MSDETERGWTAQWGDEHDAAIAASREALEYARKVVTRAKEVPVEVEPSICEALLAMLLEASKHHAQMLNWKRDYTMPRRGVIHGVYGPPDLGDPGFGGPDDGGLQ